MPAYLITHFTITDADGFARYAKDAGPLGESFGTRLLSMADDPRVLEGDYEKGRTMVVEFPSMEVLEEWYASPENQELSRLRREVTVTHSMVMVPGLEP